MSTDNEITSEQDAAQLVIEVIGVAPKAIKTEDDYNDGMKWLAGVVSRRKKVEGLFELLDKPLRKILKDTKEGLADSKARMERILEPLTKEESSLKQLTGQFFMKKRAEAQKKQDEENERNRQKVQAAIDAGKPAESVAPPKVVQTLQTTIKQDGGPTATMRLVKNWRLTKAPAYCQAMDVKIYRSDHPELLMIPDQCWVLDTAKANSVAKSGMSPALELYDVPSPAVSG